MEISNDEDITAERELGIYLSGIDTGIKFVVNYLRQLAESPENTVIRGFLLEQAEIIETAKVELEDEPSGTE